MTEQEDYRYHQQRATDELNRGLSTSNLSAARAHLRLSSLHMERARQLGGTAARATQPPFVVS